ncbi:hypothetical protein JXA05_01265 [Candidatus Peregrinibacteria bacterium]|nr:hypothetical protein [Candidatus Peregrinibacteria bacterium]
MLYTLKSLSAAEPLDRGVLVYNESPERVAMVEPAPGRNMERKDPAVKESMPPEVRKALMDYHVSFKAPEGYSVGKPKDQGMRMLELKGKKYPCRTVSCYMESNMEPSEGFEQVAYIIQDPDTKKITAVPYSDDPYDILASIDEAEEN